MKRLIINADEFGIARCVTAAVWQCLNEGVLTSATIVAGGLDFEHAASLVKSTDVCGLHLSLTDFMPVSRKERIRSLVREDGKRLWPLKRFLPRYFSGKIWIEDVRTELESQIVKCLDCGIRLTHIDGHSNLHMMPAVFKIVLELMKKYNIMKLRLPSEPLFNIDIKQPVQYMIKCVVTLDAMFNKRHIPPGYVFPDHFVGHAQSARITEDVMLGFLDRMEDGATEIPIHPRNYDEAQIREAFGADYPTDYFRKKDEFEKEALLSDKVRRMVAEKKITLISYKEL